MYGPAEAEDVAGAAKTTAATNDADADADIEEDIESEIRKELDGLRTSKHRALFRPVKVDVQCGKDGRFLPERRA
jgi:hypothetical protein